MSFTFVWYWPERTRSLRLFICACRLGELSAFASAIRLLTPERLTVSPFAASDTSAPDVVFDEVPVTPALEMSLLAPAMFEV